MKNPNSAFGVGAFPVTETATLASPVSLTVGLPQSSPHRRFRWCPMSNSVERLTIVKGAVAHV